MKFSNSFFSIHSKTGLSRDPTGLKSEMLLKGSRIDYESSFFGFGLAKKMERSRRMAWDVVKKFPKRLRTLRFRGVEEVVPPARRFFCNIILSKTHFSKKDFWVLIGFQLMNDSYCCCNIELGDPKRFGWGWFVEIPARPNQKLHPFFLGLIEY